MIQDESLKPIERKVHDQTPLTHEDGVTLFRSGDIHGIGELAHAVRTRLHGKKTFFNRNRHINYSNICALSCKFCSFFRKKGQEGAYEMPVEEIVKVAKEAQSNGATEVHIVGGLHPWLKFDYYLRMMREIRENCPGLHIKAFTAIEIIHFSRISRQPVVEVLRQLQEAGLGSLPGGGAEIFDERVHDETFKTKADADQWYDVHRIAHSLGIYSNATMLYGHVESVEDRVTHMVKLREMQKQSLEAGNGGGASFNCFIPLSFAPKGSALSHLTGTTGHEDLKTLAISRLMLDNIPHIKAFWIMQGIGLAQVALSWGCDDLDGTVVWYDITKTGQAGTHQELTGGELVRLIRQAGYEAVERDTLYRAVGSSAVDVSSIGV